MVEVLRVGNDGANVSKSDDEKWKWLDKKEDEEVVFPVEHIKGSTKEEVGSNHELRDMNSVNIEKQSSS